MTPKETEIIVLNRAGQQKAKYTFASTETVGDLKQHIKAQTRISLERQYITLGSATSSTELPRVVLEDDRKPLRDLPFDRYEFTVTLKDLGPQIGWKTVFLVEYAGPIFIFVINYLIALKVKGNLGRVQNIAFALVLIHYIKRELETLYVHIFSHGTMPLRNIFKNSAHYWIICGVAISTELFFFKDPKSSGISEQFQLTLAGAMLVFEFMNLMCHITLKNLRSPANPKGRGIPFGWGFNQVSCANYYWEVLSWFAFALLMECWSAWVFLIFSSVQMTIWALKKHSTYKKEFDGKEGRPQYPRGRKAIIPFLL